MTNERIAMIGIIITLITVLSNLSIYLVSGGFSAGNKLTKIELEMKMIRQEIKASNDKQEASNKMQDYRVEQLENKINNK